MTDVYCTTGEAITIGTPKCTNFTLMVGEAARVVINLETGKVTFEGCTPDNGAKAFWDAVERMGMKRNERA